MRTLKIRRRTDNKILYQTLLLPDDAQIRLFVDKNGVEVYDDERITDGEHTLHLQIGKSLNEYRSLDIWELERASGGVDRYEYRMEDLR